MRAKVKTRPYQIEIRNPDDELVTHAPVSVHIERMRHNYWWMRISTNDEAVIVQFHARGAITSSMFRDGAK